MSEAPEVKEEPCEETPKPHLHIVHEGEVAQEANPEPTEQQDGMSAAAKSEIIGGVLGGAAGAAAGASIGGIGIAAMGTAIGISATVVTGGLALIIGGLGAGVGYGISRLLDDSQGDGDKK